MICPHVQNRNVIPALVAGPTPLCGFGPQAGLVGSLSRSSRAVRRRFTGAPIIAATSIDVDWVPGTSPGMTSLVLAGGGVQAVQEVLVKGDGARGAPSGLPG